jgi:hypothetical protein
MALDPEYLRQHYASLSDGALLSLDREELVEVAQKIYDEEVSSRQLGATPKSRRVSAPSGDPRQAEMADEEMEIDEEDGTPGWLEDAAEVYSRHETPGNVAAPEADHARLVLEDAGIPCYLELFEEAPEEQGMSPKSRWRLLVPGKLSQWATSVLDRDIFNAEFEDQWRNHLELLTDEEVREMEPEVAFCGLYDRIERINRVYDEELERRRMAR